MLILSETQIASLKLDPIELIDAIDTAFQRGDADSVNGMKTQVSSVDGGYCQALPAVLIGRNRAAVKWVSVSGGKAGSPHIQASIILSDACTGEPLALLASAGLTAIRTAAMSGLAARYLMHADARTIGFLGCGVQARSHLDVFMRLFRQITSVLCFAPTSAERFAKEVQALGVDATPTDSAREVVESCDIVISSVPDRGDGSTPTCDAGWIKPRSFVSMVDLGRSWIPGSQSADTRIFTDYIPQSERLVDMGKLKFATRFEADLYGLAQSRNPRCGVAPSVFAFGGLGICDAVVADLAYQTALNAHSGTQVDMT